jgi:hypothetical protein
MTKDKTMVAAMLNPPFSVRAEKAGLKDMGTAAAALGAYQGTSAFVLRNWGKANTDTLVKYIEAYIEGRRWSFDPKNRAEAVALLAERLKLPPDIAGLAYDSTKDDFSPDGAIDMEGVKNVLKLRAQYEGGGTREISRPVLLSESARRALTVRRLAELDFAVDRVRETDLADGEHHLGLDGLVPFQSAIGHRRTDRLFNFLL